MQIGIVYSKKRSIDPVLGKFNATNYIEITNKQYFLDFKQEDKYFEIDLIFSKHFIKDVLSYLKKSSINANEINFSINTFENITKFTLQVFEKTDLMESVEFNFKHMSIQEIIDCLDNLQLTMTDTDLLIDLGIKIHDRKDHSKFIEIIDNTRFKFKLNNLSSFKLEKISLSDAYVISDEILNIKVKDKDYSLNEYILNLLIGKELISSKMFENDSNLVSLLYAYQSSQNIPMYPLLFKGYIFSSIQIKEIFNKIKSQIYSKVGESQTEDTDTNTGADIDSNIFKTVLTEEELEQLILENPWIILDDIDDIESQKENNAGVIDLFGKDKEGRYVVIELKIGRSSDRVVGQIARYMGAIKDNLNKKEEKITTMFVRMPSLLKMALEEAKNIGAITNSSEFIRNAVMQKLQSIGVWEIALKKKLDIEEKKSKEI